MCKVYGIIEISKIEFFNFSDTERVNILYLLAYFALDLKMFLGSR